MAFNTQVLLTWHCERSGALYELAQPRRYTATKCRTTCWILSVLVASTHHNPPIKHVWVWNTRPWLQGMQITVNSAIFEWPSWRYFFSFLTFLIPCNPWGTWSTTTTYMGMDLYGLHLRQSGARDHLEDDSGSMLQEQCTRVKTGRPWIIVRNEIAGEQFLLFRNVISISNSPVSSGPACLFCTSK